MADVDTGSALTMVKHVMTGNPMSIPPSETVWTAIDLVQRHCLTGLIVIESNRVVGMVTPRELLRQPYHRPIFEVMRKQITYATPGMSLAHAQTLLTRQRLDVLPVLENERLLGMISLTAVLEARAQEADRHSQLPGFAQEQLRLSGVTLKASTDRCTASVELALGDRTGIGSAIRRIYGHGRGLSFLVAEATLQAITQTLGKGHIYTLEDLVEIPGESGELIAVVVLSAGTGEAERFVGAVRGPDLEHTIPNAILSALSCWPARPVG